ncbi:MAG TPA: POTRA domain-containing protein, partial [Saprospiraceae bacterium]|nr:POTRA domain-containing protein [Saprospiraceae bacterium]
MPIAKQVMTWLALLLCLVPQLQGQTVTVTSITVSGLKRTKESIVFRELTFRQNDTLPQRELGTIMQRNQDNLLNLGIFNEVVVNVKEWDTQKNTIEVSIDVKESWYIYALPILELADRNFNVWWTTYHHSFDRLNLGGRLDFLNFTGRNDKLKAKIQLGYTPKQEIEYRFPYLNRRQSLGVTIGMLHSANKEISYSTIDNHEQFIQLNERKLLDRWRFQASSVYRPNLFLKYELTLTLQAYKVDSQIVSGYNDIYFRNGDTRHSTLIAKASFEYDDRDFKIYPARGVLSYMEIEKTGFGENQDENNFTGTARVEWNSAFGARFQQRLTGIG